MTGTITAKEPQPDNSYSDFIKQNRSLIDYGIALLTDIQQQYPDHLYNRLAKARDLACFEKRTKSEGIVFLTKTLSNLSKGLFSYLEYGTVRYPSFMIKKNTVYPLFLSGLFSLALGKGDHEVKAVRHIYQFSVAFTKLKGPYPQSVVKASLDAFIQSDKDLKKRLVDEYDRCEIERLAREEISELFKNVDCNNSAIPRPGPGSTNTPVDPHLRYKPLVWYAQIDEVMPYLEYYFVNRHDFFADTKYWTELFRNMKQGPTSRFKLVFKKFGKPRGICMEEAEMQYMQQGVKHVLYHHVQTHPLTRGYVNFDDQDINANFALSLSYTKQGGTIDMENASNNVLRDVVSSLWRDTEIHDILIGLSTTEIIFSKEYDLAYRMRTNMYAPMGSALCFPIMALTHWALIRALIRFFLSERHVKDVYVYGDDIIIPTYARDIVYKYLPWWGMALNYDKSFFTSGFRESCGVHAYNGVDITPIYVKHIPTSTDISHAMSCLSVENQLYYADYPLTASLFRHNMVKLFGELPIVSETSPIFGFKRKGNFFPITLKRVRRKVGPCGYTWRFRVASPKKFSRVIPSEEEGYLRHALQKCLSREIVGATDRQKLVWQDVQAPSVFGIPNQLDKQTVKAERPAQDIKKEKHYEYLSQKCQGHKDFGCSLGGCINSLLWRGYGCYRYPTLKGPVGPRMGVRIGRRITILRNFAQGATD